MNHKSQQEKEKGKQINRANAGLAPAGRRIGAERRNWARVGFCLFSYDWRAVKNLQGQPSKLPEL
jgi:hypothetical protein